jgi:hypothetical protein
VAFSSLPVFQTLTCLWWGVVGLAACGDSEKVSFEIRLADEACVERAAQGAALDLYLLPIDEGGKLCQLRHRTVKSEPSTVVDVGSLGVDEIVVLVLVRADAQCVRCHAVARVLLRPELTRFDLSLSPAADCRIPEATLSGLGLPSTLLSLPSCEM